MKKIWISGIILFAAIGMLGGCSRKDPALDPNLGLTAKGRFVEEEIPVPEELKSSRFVNCLVYDDTIEILSYSKAGDQYFHYIYDGQTWEPQNSDIENVAEQITIKGIVRNTGGEKYFYGYDKDREYHILPSNPESPALLSAELSSLSAKDENVWIEQVAVQADGTILVSTQDRAILFTEQGEILHEFAQDYNQGQTRESAFLTDTAYITILNQKLVSYSLKEGTMSELNSTQEFDVTSCVYSDQEGSIYIANEKGLYHINENSSIVEKLIDGNLNSMSLQTDNIRAFVKHNKNEFTSVMTSMVDGNVSAFKYIYNPDISTLPQDTVTVYSLNDSPTLRQAAALMQSQNPNVRVEIRIAAGKEYESLTEDLIRSLNAELLNGSGPDILILDGLPKDAYKEKGILVNLNGLFSEIQAEHPFLPNITPNYVDGQGAVYYLPVRFKMPIMFGEKSALEALSNAVRPEGKGQDESLPVLGADNYGNLERLILNIYYKQVFPNGDNQLSEEGLRNYLEFVKKTGEKAQAQAAFTPDQMNALGVDNTVSGIGNRGNGPVAFAQGKTQIGFENIGSIQDSMLTFGALEKQQLSPETLDGIFYPCLIAGINKNTENLELAKEYLKVLYSPDIQNQDLSDGFGILDSAIQRWGETERDTRMEISDYDGSVIISAAWPAKEKRAKLIELIKSLSTPVDIDPHIINIITENSKSYYEGKQDLDTTVNFITNKVSLLNAERTTAAKPTEAKQFIETIDNADLSSYSGDWISWNNPDKESDGGISLSLTCSGNEFKGTLSAWAPNYNRLADAELSGLIQDNIGEFHFSDDGRGHSGTVYISLNDQTIQIETIIDETSKNGDFTFPEESIIFPEESIILQKRTINNEENRPHI